MRPSTRLAVIAGSIVLSAAYALLIVADSSLASAVSSGYVALLLTIIVLVNLWKKPE